MSFFDHLAELRRRIIWSLIPGGIGLAVALYFTDRIMKFLARPLGKLNTTLVFTTPTEAFWTYMKVAMITGVFLAMPVILWNVWTFVAPGLKKHERRYAAPFIIKNTQRMHEALAATRAYVAARQLMADKTRTILSLAERSC